MRLTLFAAMTAFLAVIASQANAASCPADPERASYAIWKVGELKMKVEATGKHPCGREMTCTGGSVKRQVKRICRWL